MYKITREAARIGLLSSSGVSIPFNAFSVFADFQEKQRVEELNNDEERTYKASDILSGLSRDSLDSFSQKALTSGDSLEEFELVVNQAAKGLFESANSEETELMNSLLELDEKAKIPETIEKKLAELFGDPNKYGDTDIATGLLSKGIEYHKITLDTRLSFYNEHGYVLDRASDVFNYDGYENAEKDLDSHLSKIVKEDNNSPSQGR